ncbi:TetR/AcrR family transcriptional regulator [Leucobacter chromiireducens]|uniref:TetR/AcrR family transcriptional regulator n=1 Tax=Leucobacter chromiireducens subsp. solipictus TaxID=398235 RepID=A0ABS1SF14_9MICO|nr:TetR/AcrR family transcriptional regulator [Leucobacter chromiireducens]MBL3678981.1 TetR/AcrR family transcriptional regulator [Leucobacter chromiireducens subsp. solipictus]
MSATPRPQGRPRSEDARRAILHAADDLLVAEGYAALTMKGIAEKAGVGRQTVYRWWSSKAEILLEASAADAARELTVAAAGPPEAVVTEFLAALGAFLTASDAGLAYRALLGEAQHDPQVAELMRGQDVLGDAARAVIRRIRGAGPGEPELSDDALVAELVGPTLFRVLAGGTAPAAADHRALARRFLRPTSRTVPGDD